MRRLATDQRLDVFSFGISAYEVCTFNLPWERGITGQVAMSHASDPADIARYRPKINPVLGQAIMSCVEPNVAKRCPSLDVFLKKIRDVKHEDQA